MVGQAQKLCRLGAIDKDLADFFEINEDTVNRWKKDHPEFGEALRAGKMQADAEVADRLYHRALGYTHDEEKIFCNKDGEVTRVTTKKHYAPDTMACMYWLNNRQGSFWRQRQEVTGKDGEPLQITPVINVTVGEHRPDTAPKAG